MKKNLTLLSLIISLGISAHAQITWSAGVNIAANSYSNMHPRVTADASGNPLVIWGRMSDQSVFFSRWNGTMFTTPVKLNQASMTIATGSWMGPDIASKGDTVYVVFKQTPEADTTSHIYMVRSYDGGMNFSTAVRVDFIGDSISRFPTVTTNDSGDPLVGFMKFNPAFGDARWVVSKSTDFGNTFSTDVKASGWSSATSTVCDCCPGSISNSGSTTVMLYRDNNSNIRDMWAGISTDGGNSFNQGLAVDQGNWMLFACPSSGPDGVIFGDTLYTVYMSGAASTYLVWLSKTSLSSMQPTTGLTITGPFAGLTQQNFPRIAQSGNAAAVVWVQTVNGNNQLPILFTDNITNGFPTVPDTVDVNNITNTDIVLKNGNIFVVWQDDNSGTVKYRKGTFTPITSVNELEETHSSVYPNPVSNQLNISSKNFSSAELFSIDGRKVLKTNQGVTDISSLSNGIYFLKITSGNQSCISKIAKQ